MVDSTAKPRNAADAPSRANPSGPDGASAGFARRVAALLYDSVLLSALLVVFTSGAVFLNQRTAVDRTTAGAWVYLYRAGLLGVIVGYYLLNWTRSGQTLGMRAWHLRAVTAAGQPLSLRAAALRFVFGAMAWVPLALGVLWLYFDPEHLALHDRLSKTRVLHVPRE